jgi:hypothetical protein
MTEVIVKKTLSNEEECEKLLLNDKVSPMVYYQTLDYASKILFKQYVIEQLQFSSKTFHRRMADGRFRPGELMIIEIIIANSTFLRIR